jgi:hypothetical protein
LGIYDQLKMKRTVKNICLTQPVYVRVTRPTGRAPWTRQLFNFITMYLFVTRRTGDCTNAEERPLLLGLSGVPSCYQASNQHTPRETKANTHPMQQWAQVSSLNNTAQELQLFPNKGFVTSHITGSKT